MRLATFTLVSMPETPQIAVFLSQYGFSGTAAVLNVLVLLARDGYEVDVFIHEPWDDPAQVAPLHPSIRIHHLTPPAVPPRPAWTDRLHSQVRQLLKIKTPPPVIAPSALEAAVAIMKTKRYRCYFGVEPGGLIFAGLVAERLPAPLLYFSLELYVTSNPYCKGEKFQQVKKLERRYHPRAVATIIQDEERARVLLDDNRTTGGKVFYMPVGLLGEPVRTRNRYFHERFQLPATERVALQLGSIHRHRLSGPIAQMTHRLPAGWSAVMHGLIEPSFATTLKSLAAPGRLHLSADLVALERLPMLAAAADIGLVFYTNDNVNDFLTGFASDKMARHLQAGTPVVTVNFPSFRRIIDQYRCGVCVEDPQQIPAAIATIAADYEGYQAGTVACYTDHYEMSRHFRAVLDFIRTLPG